MSRRRRRAPRRARWNRPRVVIPAVAVLLLVVAVVAALATRGGDTPDNAAFAAALSAQRAQEVTVQGTVRQLLPDSSGADGTHQRFDLDVGGVLVEVDHNVSLAPRVPVQVGDTVIVHGQFEPDPGHPVIHYTHHSTSAHHEGGWIELAGQRYD